jgi:hypothetical protein
MSDSDSTSDALGGYWAPAGKQGWLDRREKDLASPFFDDDGPE